MPHSHPEKVSGDALAIVHGLTDAEYFEEALRRSKAESAAARPGIPLETAAGHTEEQDQSEERKEQRSAGRRDRTEEFKPAGWQPASTPSSLPFGWRQRSSREYGKAYYRRYTTMDGAESASGSGKVRRHPGVCRALP